MWYLPLVVVIVVVVIVVVVVVVDPQNPQIACLIEVPCLKFRQICIRSVMVLF